VFLVAAGALLLASDDDAADRRARFAVVGRDLPSADAAQLDADNVECSTDVARQQRATTSDVPERAASAHLFGVRWSSCESSNGGVVEPPRQPRPPVPPSKMTSTARRGRYLAVHRYAPQNTSTGSSTSGVDVSMSSSRSELVWGGGGRRRSTTGAGAAAPGCVAVVSSVDADCEDNCDDVVDDSLSLYRSSSFRRAIERGGNASPPTPAVDDPGSQHHVPAASRFAPSLTSGARFSAATFHHQPPDTSLSHRFGAGCGGRLDGREVANPCVSPDDLAAANRAVWDVIADTSSQHVEDIDPFHCFGLSAELGYDSAHSHT